MNKDDELDPYYIDSITLTQEEIDELTALFDENVTINTDAGNPNHRCAAPEDYDDYSYPPVISYRKHEWRADLLLTSTVYTCKWCGAKKEETKSTYCYEK